MTDRIPGTAPAPSGIAEGEIEAAREELRAQLPELRKLPGFPHGTDDDIVAMSIPPYYTACPNPFIEEWLGRTKPDGYNDRDYEDPGPYASDVSVGKSHPIYKAHSYPTKVPHQAIMRYILHYTKPGDVVLDGFCGTGMTGVAAQACANPEPDLKAQIEEEFKAEGRKPQWGARRAILQDLSPSATFIAAGLNLPIDADAFDTASKEILERFDEEWGWMYETTHSDGSKAKIDYTVWSEVFTCPHCGSEVVFYDAAFDEAVGKVRESFNCPHCGVVVSKRSLDRRMTSNLDPLLGTQVTTVKRIPVAVAYRVGAGKVRRPPTTDDMEVLSRIEGLASRVSLPRELIPYMHQTHERNNFAASGIRYLHQMWTSRPLVALDALWMRCRQQSDPLTTLALEFWVEQAVLGLSLQNRYVPAHYSHVNQYFAGFFFLSSLHAECSPWYTLVGTSPSRGKRRSLVKIWGSRSASRSTSVGTASSGHLTVPDASVDYVFVDPPFGDNIAYSDLAYPLESWKLVRTDVGSEAIVDRNRERPKTLSDYAQSVLTCFQEFFRVLRPGRWMTVEFSNSSNSVWLTIQAALSSAGFVVADTRVFDKEQRSFNQIVGRNVVKRDLIISAYKPSRTLEEQFSVVAGSADGAWKFTSEHLAHLPVVEGKRGAAHVVRERQADRLYDRMVAYHVHRGAAVPMTATEFYTALDERLPMRDDMYFLPEQVEDYERHRMTFKDLAQAELFITGESSAVTWLRQRVKRKPATYDEVQPDYFRELQAGLPDWEQLPDLKVLLDENFLQDGRNRWYVPDPKKATDLEQLRTKALLKQFQTYVDSKGRLDQFRSEAVREGFRQAWRARDYALIVMVGDRLPVSALEDDEQLFSYYDNARRLK